MEEKRIYTKKCECGALFVPKIKGQQHCLDCIMKKEPPRPKNSDKILASDFVDWFIYQWRTIRRAAAVKYGVPYEDGGVKNETIY